MVNRHRPLVHVLRTTVLLLLLVPLAAPIASAKDTWISVRSKNFLLVGDASEKEIRQVAVRLEQFREAYTLLFSNAPTKPLVPTTVIVFKNDNSYKPFKPTSYTAGYFQAGEDINYITLTSERMARNDEPFRVIFHEYVHLMVNSTLGTVPTWFSEGLAEYYSSFSINDDRKVTLGRVVGNHVLFLRQQKLLPLRTLFGVDHTSPYYNEKDQANVFYAQAWALVHYLILGNQGQRNHQMSRFLELINTGKSTDAAFTEAFQTTYEALEKGLQEYIQRRAYPAQTVILKNKLGADSEIVSTLLSEAEAQAYLGDLLLHSQRLDAEAYLQKALTLNPALGMANSSLGLLRARQGRFEEARRHLEKAVAANSQNYLAHYYYALALSRQGMDSNNVVYGYAPESLAVMRRELLKVIELAPDFAEGYHLLAFVNLVASEQLDESIGLMKKALTLSPGRAEYVFVLGQIYLSQEKFDLARQLFQPLAQSGADKELRQRARSLLDRAIFVEDLRQRQAEFNRNRGRGNGVAESQDKEITLDPLLELEEALRKPAAGEARVVGNLIRIDCGPKTIVFTIQVGESLMKVQTESFKEMSFRTFTQTIKGEITCGVRKNSEPVVVTYKPVGESRTPAAGTAITMEFVPKEFRLKGQTADVRGSRQEIKARE
jgi:tetratricopeptide (TPR) repeat protein